MLIKWFVGLSLPPARNCISIDFKASVHQRRTRSATTLLTSLALSPLLWHQGDTLWSLTFLSVHPACKDTAAFDRMHKSIRLREWCVAYVGYVNAFNVIMMGYAHGCTYSRGLAQSKWRWGEIIIQVKSALMNEKYLDWCSKVRECHTFRSWTCSHAWMQTPLPAFPAFKKCIVSAQQDINFHFIQWVNSMIDWL